MQWRLNLFLQRWGTENLWGDITFPNHQTSITQGLKVSDVAVCSPYESMPSYMNHSRNEHA